MEITPSQAAALLGKSERTIVRWIKLGKLPAHQLKDKSYRVKTEDLERFQQQNDETLLARIEALEQRLEGINVMLIRHFGEHEELEALKQRVDALSRSQQ
jgi:excisionase family DNA binding protein